MKSIIGGTHPFKVEVGGMTLVEHEGSSLPKVDVVSRQIGTDVEGIVSKEKLAAIRDILSLESLDDKAKVIAVSAIAGRR